MTKDVDLALLAGHAFGHMLRLIHRSLTDTLRSSRL